MKKTYTIFITILLAVSSLAHANNTNNSTLLFSTKKESSHLADSIMRFVIKNSTKHAHTISAYEAEIYIKGRTEILKQNILIRFANHLFPINRKNKDMFFEMVSESKFTNPNTFHHNFKAVNGNSIPNSKKQEEVMHFLNLNVYSPTAYDEGVIMPVARKAFSLYSFYLIEINDTADSRIYKIRFEPKQASQKLVSGYLYIRDRSWTIAEIDLIGHYSFAEFNLVMTFGQDYSQFILPNKANLSLRYDILGNVVHTSYHSTFKYKKVEWVEEKVVGRQWKPLDLTNYYKLSSDTVPIIRDTSYWNSKRDVPLTKEENRLLHLGTNNNLTSLDTANAAKYLEFTEQLTNTINLNYSTTRIKYSGILNPFQLGYSASNGITYKQKVRISKTFDRDKQIRFRPELGFVFKRREVFFKVPVDWEYKPEKLGILSLSVGNSNQSYSSKMMKEINAHLKDSAFNFDDLNLDYYKTYYAELKNQIELFHGFLFESKVSFHRRIPVKKKTDINPGENVGNIISEKQTDFIPSLGVTYTPRQFYQMDGYRKQYVYSYYPTISLRYGRAIPGLFKSSGNFDQIEMNVHQSLYLGMLQRFNYNVSGGFYTRTRSTYFVDFEYFTRRNFPDSWEDKIGGVFNLLRSQWYNASDRYVQAHLMYQSPFVLSTLFDKRASKYIFSERFYISQLWTPVLPNYTEIGYGIGNHIFNIGAFVSFNKMKYERFGVKFAFELFD